MSHGHTFYREARSAPPTKRRAVLVTGAAGRIGSAFCRHVRELYDLTLMVKDENEAQRMSDFERVVTAELADADRLASLFEGMDTIVHLAADPSPQAEWQSVRENNIEGTYNVFEAAVRAKCRRVVFASSIHAVAAYPQGAQVKHDGPVNPDSLYGVSKCFGEAMGRAMAHLHGLSTIAVRIGAYRADVEQVKESDRASTVEMFVSARDLFQLFQRAIDDEAVQFAVVHGLSRNRFNRMDISETMQLLGYEPVDDFAKLHPGFRGLELE